MQPVTALHHVAGVDRLAAVCDGNLLLLDPESLKEWHVPGAKVRICHSFVRTTSIHPTEWRYNEWAAS